jgi:hypothetical protein
MEATDCFLGGAKLGNFSAQASKGEKPNLRTPEGALKMT